MFRSRVGSVLVGSSVRYLVRARNDNGYADSSQTVALSVRPPEEWRISSFRRLTTGGGQIELSFPSETGVTYGAERSTSLGGGGWSDIGGTVSGNGATQTLTVPLSGQPGTVFFRVERR
jgi:hypothetical protein